MEIYKLLRFSILIEINLTTLLNVWSNEIFVPVFKNTHLSDTQIFIPLNAHESDAQAQSLVVE